ncbi:MAG: RpiB/LacA/LacB family sugar-phosphate isomerase, partial [Thermoprotei archaeon]
MRIAIGSDYTYDIAKFVYEYLKKKGYELIPVGALKTGKLEPWPKVGFEVGKL